MRLSGSILTFFCYGCRGASLAELPSALSRLVSLRELAVCANSCVLAVQPGALHGPSLRICEFRRVSIQGSEGFRRPIPWVIFCCAPAIADGWGLMV